jgi:hypothetical protein
MVKAILIVAISAFVTMIILVILFLVSSEFFAIRDEPYNASATTIAVTNQAVERYIDMTSTAKVATPSP